MWWSSSAECRRWSNRAANFRTIVRLSVVGENHRATIGG